MKLKQQLFLGFALALCSLSALANGDLIEDGGGWAQLMVETNLKVIDPSLDKFRLWTEGQARFDQDWTHFYQGMVRTAIGYALSDRATIWAGYTWVPTENFGKPPLSQQDIWPAFRYQLPTDWGTVSFRTMIESNFLQDSEVRFRPRQMVRLVYPFEFESKLSLVTWDEFFIRINSTRFGGRSGFDQNRAFAGIGWKVDDHTRFELGYMNQYLDDAKHINNTMRHLIMGSVFMNF
ncbi:MAG: hypothetical protein RL637_61 [Pseudomonadota bacterium]